MGTTPVDTDPAGPAMPRVHSLLIPPSGHGSDLVGAGGASDSRNSSSSCNRRKAGSLEPERSVETPEARNFEGDSRIRDGTTV